MIEIVEYKDEYAKELSEIILDNMIKSILKITEKKLLIKFHNILLNQR